jgi:hypothetical protein
MGLRTPPRGLPHSLFWASSRRALKSLSLTLGRTGMTHRPRPEVNSQDAEPLEGGLDLLSSEALSMGPLCNSKGGGESIPEVAVAHS